MRNLIILCVLCLTFSSCGITNAHCKQSSKYKEGDLVTHKITKNKGHVRAKAECVHDYYKVSFSQLVKYPDGTEKYEILPDISYVYEYELD